MHKQTVEHYHHMTCDICGKTETIKEDKLRMVFSGWWTRHWSTVTIYRYRELHADCYREQLDLCPTCTKKFKKLVKMTEVDESEE